MYLKSLTLKDGETHIHTIFKSENVKYRKKFDFHKIFYELTCFVTICKD